MANTKYANRKVESSQRFANSNHCPICNGRVNDKHGLGIRCFGFISSDSTYAHCTRDEYAGSLRYIPSSQSYAHKIEGRCNCGIPHGGNRLVESLPREKGATTPAEPEKEYIYRGPDGGFRHRTLRYTRKQWKQQGWKDGHWQDTLTGVERVLYRMPELAADPEEPVYLVEGEKDADRLADLGLVSTTAAMGARTWQDSFTTCLKDRHVVIVSDNDDDGKAGTEIKATALSGVAASVKIVEFPELDKGGDVSDWLDQGHSIDDLIARVEAARPLRGQSELVPNHAEPEQTTDAPAEDDAFAFLDDVDIYDLPDLSWLIEGILPDEPVAVLYGPTNLGKTFLVLDWAFSMATGQPWNGRPTKAGSVLYVMAEGEGGMKQRVRAWKQANGFDLDARLGVNFELGAVQLLQPGEMTAFVSKVNRLDPKPVLIVLDTLHKCFIGHDENSSRDVGMFIHAAEQLKRVTGATVLIVHHSGLDTSRERGSSAFRTDAAVTLAVTKSKGRLLLSCKKLKEATKFKDIEFHLEQVILPIGDSSSVVKVDGEAATKSDDAPPASVKRILKALEAFPDGATSVEWESSVPPTPGHNSIGHGTFSKGKKYLLEEGEVSQEGEGRGAKYFVAKE